MTGLKFSQRKDGTLEVRGLGIPFGGPINGKDLHGQFFSTKTDFAWDLIPDGARPLLYQHGLDDTVKTEVVGRWGVEKVDAKGVWVRAQLSARSSYLSEIKELLTEDALGLSSATMGHLVKVNQKNGEILNWPVVELSLTPNPANPTAYVVKSMFTPARHAAKLLRVLKHGDHDQSSHGDRDGAGGSDSGDKPSSGSAPSRAATYPQAGRIESLQERLMDQQKNEAGGNFRVQHAVRLLNTAMASDPSSTTYGFVSFRESIGKAMEILEDENYHDAVEELDMILREGRTAFNDSRKKSYGRKHGDHDQSEHGNRDGATGGGSDSGDKPSQSSSPLSTGRPHATHTAGSVRRMEGHIDSQEKSLHIAEQSLDKVPPGEARDFIKERVDQAKEALAEARTIHSGGGNLHDVAERISRAEDKISSAFILAGRELGPEVRDRLDALRTEGFWSSRRAIDLANDGDKTKSYGLKHGDHDQADHGNRDGAGGGSDSKDKPSSEPNDPPGRSNEARAANPRNGNRLLPWRGRTFDPSGYPPKAMAEAREYAKESLAKIEQHIKPIDPSDDDDVRFANDEKSALTSSITVAMDQLKEGNVGAALSNLMRASSRASRNDEAKELTDALDFLYDRTAATFGLDDVVNPDNLGRFKDIRESARTHFRNLGKRSLKADFLNEDAEYGAPEEEANEESDTLEVSLTKLVDSTEYTLGEIAEALAKATDENNEVIVNCLTESQDALEKLAGELATYLEGTSPTDEVEDETETETLLASPVASLAILAGKRSRAEEDLAAVKAALKAEIRKQTLVAIGRTRDRK